MVASAPEPLTLTSVVFGVPLCVVSVKAPMSATRAAGGVAKNPMPVASAEKRLLLPAINVTAPLMPPTPVVVSPWKGQIFGTVFDALVLSCNPGFAEFGPRKFEPQTARMVPLPITYADPEPTCLKYQSSLDRSLKPKRGPDVPLSTAFVTIVSMNESTRALPILIPETPPAMSES